MRKDKRDSIVEASQALFARFGFSKTTVDEIAGAAHMAKSSLYHYFESKEDIFKAVINKESRLLSAEITRAIEKTSNPQEKLRAYVITRMQHLKKLANFYSALRDEYLEHYSFIEKARKDNLNEEKKIVKNILREGVNKKVFSISNLNLTSFAIVTALKGLEYPWTIQVQMPAIHKSIDLLLEIILNGIKSK